MLRKLTSKDTIVGIFLLSLIPIGVVLVLKAGRFPVIRRADMWLDNIPRLIVLGSGILTIASLILIYIGLFGGKTDEEGTAAQTMFCCVLMSPIIWICIAHLGVTLNGALDTTTPNIFRTSVVRKHIFDPS